jgi:opine dehydrogenase
MNGSNDPVRVGIAGAGSIAFATAALLELNGHFPILWSPSGERAKALSEGEPLIAKGAIEGVFHPGIAMSAAELASRSDVVLLALPGYGHKVVMDALAPHIKQDQPVIISSHASFGALYLGRLLASRGISVPITCWGTTAVTGRQQGAASVQVNTVRARIDLCTLPDDRSDGQLDLCNRLFGERFQPREGLLAISLSNLNPQNHMGIALGNMSRMEHGEVWSQGLNVTPNIGRLLEALDAERLAVAETLGLEVKTIFEHFHLSFHVPVASISEMNQEMHRQGNGGTGPATADSRYVTEDVPYGLVPTVMLGELAQRPARLHRSGVEIFSAMYGRDFFAENELLKALEFERMSLDELKRAATGQFD